MKKIEEIKFLNDKACKNLLSIKRVLAVLIKDCIPEFKAYDYETIEKCIIGKKEENNKIISLKSKDNTSNTKEVYYDLLYKAKLPNSNNEIDLIINIEPQGDSDPGYEIANRGLYYASRLLSSQKVEENKYDSLKKVYSVWIIADRNAKSKSSVSVVSPNKTDTYKKYITNKDLKLINVVLIYIGTDVEEVIKDKSNNYSNIIKVVNDLITKNDIPIAIKLKSLKDNYGIIVSKEDVNNMHWSNDIANSSFREGKSQGMAQGIAQGMAQGMYQGELSASKKYIEAIMSSLNVDFDKAAELLKISDDDKSKVLKEMNISSSN